MTLLLNHGGLASATKPTASKHERLYAAAEEMTRAVLRSLMDSPLVSYEKNSGLLLYTVLDTLSCYGQHVLELDILSAYSLVKKDSNLDAALRDALSTMDFRALLQHRMSSSVCIFYLN
jgi:CRISPR/Cas system CMR-associated protein Cmr3 (group 5 of RAMP superfamily)